MPSPTPSTPLTSIASSTAIDLSRLPAPAIIAPLDHAAILARLSADYLARWPAYDAVVESDPVQKLLELAAYQELLLRAEFNARAAGALIAYAAGGDLDNLAALYGVSRLVITPADVANNVAAVLEDDDALRARVLLAPDSFTVAGPASAYVFHALSADAGVIDASATSPTPGDVVVTILARPTLAVPSGAPSLALIATVAAALSADTVRPLTDRVSVAGPVVTDFAVDAQLWVYPGPDANLIHATALAAVTDWLALNRRLGRDIPRSALIAALHVGGVQRVALTSPAADLVFGATAIGFASAISVAIVGAAE